MFYFTKTISGDLPSQKALLSAVYDLPQGLFERRSFPHRGAYIIVLSLIADSCHVFPFG
jgi:hypothetical protein